MYKGTKTKKILVLVFLCILSIYLSINRCWLRGSEKDKDIHTYPLPLPRSFITCDIQAPNAVVSCKCILRDGGVAMPDIILLLYKKRATKLGQLKATSIQAIPMHQPELVRRTYLSDRLLTFCPSNLLHRICYHAIPPFFPGTDGRLCWPRNSVAAYHRASFR